MKSSCLFIVFALCVFQFRQSLAAPRLSVADAPDEIDCTAHARPPFVALVDVLGIDPSGSSWSTPPFSAAV